MSNDPTIIGYTRWMDELVGKCGTELDVYAWSRIKSCFNSLKTDMERLAAEKNLPWTGIIVHEFANDSLACLDEEKKND